MPEAPVDACQPFRLSRAPGDVAEGRLETWRLCQLTTVAAHGLCCHHARLPLLSCADRVATPRYLVSLAYGSLASIQVRAVMRASAVAGAVCPPA